MSITLHFVHYKKVQVNKKQKPKNYA